MFDSSATIKKINVYNDGLIELIAECNLCKNINIHTITHSSTKLDDKNIFLLICFRTKF